MIQRFLYMALADGIEQIEQDPTLLEQLFEELYELAPTEVAGIKEVFAAKPPKVIHGYAPRDVDPPVYSIVLGNERESDSFLGNDGMMVCDTADPDYGADTQTAIWQHTYSVLTYTEHPDVTSYYYEIAKSIILASTDFFADRGLFDIQVMGQDLAPDPRYMPEHLFARNMTFQCNREFQRVARESKAGKAFRVGGIHIDESGSPSDVGGVKTLVVPIAPEDLE